MGDGYGKLLLLLLGIGLILLAMTTKGRQVIGVLVGAPGSGGSVQKIPESNPTDLTKPGSKAGSTDLRVPGNVG